MEKFSLLKEIKGFCIKEWVRRDEADCCAEDCPISALGYCNGDPREIDIKEQSK